MASSETALTPPYFETCWAILSIIGLNNIFLGLMIGGITGKFSNVLLVPIIVSAAFALANGLIYFTHYTNYSALSRAVASVFVDLSFLIGEAGLNFYSYLILAGALRRGEWKIFLALFWPLIFCFVVIRAVFLVICMSYILNENLTPAVQRMENYMVVGSFVALAIVESVSAVFLLRIFRAAIRWPQSSTRKPYKGLHSYLMRSTQIRVATLAPIGITRAITFAFRTTEVSAVGVASQIDRFAATLECLFPIVMFIDIIASRFVFASESSARSKRFDVVWLTNRQT